jgi:hypothetical protein
MHFFPNADIPVPFETLAWIQAFLVDPNPHQMKPTHDSGGEPVCPFAKPNALYMFHTK